MGEIAEDGWRMEKIMEDGGDSEDEGDREDGGDSGGWGR